MKRSDEASPPVKTESLQRAARSFMATTAVGFSWASSKTALGPF